jgi:hypothetical protein
VENDIFLQMSNSILCLYGIVLNSFDGKLSPFSIQIHKNTTPDPSK